MKSPKRKYKNVYTIFEKVKKGEIESYYKEEDSLFSRLSFYKKPDLIKPNLHYLDERKVLAIVDGYLTNPATIKKQYENFKGLAVFKKIPDDKKPSYGKFTEKYLSNFNKLPEHLKYDMFKMYYNKVDKVDFEEKTDKNRGKYLFIEKGNSPVGKIMSEQSQLKSAIFTRHVFEFFLTQMVKLEFEDQQASDSIKESLDDASNDDNFKTLSDKMFSSGQAQKRLDKAIQDASDLCKKIDDVIDAEGQQELFENVNIRDEQSGASKISTDYIATAADSLKSIKMSMSNLKEKIKKIMDRSKSYFSSKKETIREDLFNSDNIAGLDDYVALHPKLRKILIEDITVTETKNIGKINIYIDISGSMSGSCSVPGHSGISRIDFAKSFALKMKELDLLNEVYVFDTRVRKYKKDEFSLAVLSPNGGTTIDNVVNHIRGENKDAIIITDADDYCKAYSEKAFFIGIAGARFHHFGKEILKQYNDNNQLIVFDGSSIKKVDDNGFIIK